MDRTVESLTKEEYEKLLKAMETHEGWQEGFEEFKEVEEITATMMNKKKVISEYLVRGTSGERWLLKDVAIAIAEEGCLSAIVVHTKTGLYLRPKHGCKSFKELLCRRK